VGCTREKRVGVGGRGVLRSEKRYIISGVEALVGVAMTAEKKVDTVGVEHILQAIARTTAKLRQI